MNESYRFTTFLLLLVVILLMIMSRVYLGSAVEYRRAVESERQDKIDLAIAHYGRSIKWYVPMSPWGKRSLAALWDIGQRYWADGDTETAIFAMNTLRSAVYSARGPFTPFKGWINRADDWLVSHVPEAHPEISGEKIAEVLSREPSPNRLWSFIVGAGLVGWILSVFAFIFTVLPGPNEKVRNGRAVIVGLCVVVFYVLWIMGLYWA
jgi:hypothetical protein